MQQIVIRDDTSVANIERKGNKEIVFGVIQGGIGHENYTQYFSNEQ